MNDKEAKIYQILDATIESCTMNIEDGIKVTREDILGKSRQANIHMTRCIFVTELVICFGYTTASVAALLHRTTPAIRHLLNAAHSYRISNPSYVLAEAETTVKCKDLIPEIIKEKQVKNNFKITAK